MISSGELPHIIQWIDEALDLARQAAAQDEVPVGAVVIKDGIIIGRGYNLRETKQSPIAHAEVLAIQQAAQAMGTWRLTGCLLVVTLEPCPMCLGVCQQARVDRVIYASKDPKGGALSLGYTLHQDVRTNHRFEVEHFESAECGKILSQFFQKKRKGGKVSP